jgi:hypothetical protein
MKQITEQLSENNSNSEAIQSKIIGTLTEMNKNLEKMNKKIGQSNGTKTKTKISTSLKKSVQDLTRAPVEMLKAPFEGVSKSMKDVRDSFKSGVGKIFQGKSEKKQADLMQSLLDVSKSGFSKLHTAFAKLKDAIVGNDLKRAEQERERMDVLEDIASSSASVQVTNKSSESGEFGGIFSKGLKAVAGLSAGAIAAPLITLKSFFSELKIQTQKLDKLLRGGLGKIFSPITRFFNAIANSKVIQGISKVFNNTVKPFFTQLGKFFGLLDKAGKTAGIFGKIMTVAGNIGKILGKIFYPITVLIGLFNFVKGFIDGYSEGGLLEGIKKGAEKAFDAIIGSFAKLLADAASFVFDILGFDNFSQTLTDQVDSVFGGLFDSFGGILDIIKGIFTFDLETIKSGITATLGGLVDIITSPIDLAWAFIQDLFSFVGIELPSFDLGKLIKDVASSIGSFVKGVFDNVTKFFTSPFKTIKNTVETLFSGTVDLLMAPFRGIFKILENIFNFDFVGAIKKIPGVGAVMKFIGGIFGGGKDKKEGKEQPIDNEARQNRVSEIESIVESNQRRFRFNKEQIQNLENGAKLSIRDPETGESREATPEQRQEYISKLIQEQESLQEQTSPLLKEYKQLTKQVDKTAEEGDAKNKIQKLVQDILGFPMRIVKKAINKVKSWLNPTWFLDKGKNEEGEGDGKNKILGLIQDILGFPFTLAKGAIDKVLGFFGMGGDSEEGEDNNKSLISDILSIPLLPFKIVKTAVDTVLGFFGAGGGDDSEEGESNNKSLINNILSIPLLPFKIVKNAVDTVLGFFGIGKDSGGDNSEGESNNKTLIEDILSIPLLPFNIVRGAVKKVLGFFGMGDDSDGEGDNKSLIDDILSIPLLPFKIVKNAVDTVLGWFGGGSDTEEGEGGGKKNFFSSLWSGITGWIMSLFGVDADQIEGISITDVFQILIDGIKDFFGGLFDFMPSMDDIKNAALDFLPNWMRPKSQQERADKAAKKLENRGEVTREEVLEAKTEEELDALAKRADKNSLRYGYNDAMRDIERILAAEDMSMRKGSGGFRNFGRGSLAMLHGKEAVIPYESGAGQILQTFNEALQKPTPSTGVSLNAVSAENTALNQAAQAPVVVAPQSGGNTTTNNRTSVTVAQTNHIDATMRSAVMGNAF